MEIIRVACIIVGYFTIVRYTFAEKDLTNKPCQNKKCRKVSDPFEIAEIDLTAGEKQSPNFVKESGDLFNEMKKTANVKKITEVYDNGFYSALCWVEITTITEFKNGSNSATREYAISFESPSDIPKKYLTKEEREGAEIVTYEIFDKDTKKSEVVHFTTVEQSGSVTVRQNRKTLCGSGPIYTKEYLEWLNSNKKMIVLRVSPKKQNLIASECEDGQQKSYDGSTESDVTLRQERLSNPPQPEIANGHLNNTKGLGKILFEKMSNGSNFDYGMLLRRKEIFRGPEYVSSTMRSQTKFNSNDEMTSIIVRLGAENIEEPESDKVSNGRPNLNRYGTTEEEIVFKMKSGFGHVTDKTDSLASQSKIEDYSTNTENFFTSTEATTVDIEEYLSFSTSRKVTEKPQITRKPITKNVEDPSSTSTKGDSERENLVPKNGKPRKNMYSRSRYQQSIEKNGQPRSMHIMAVKPPKMPARIKISKLNDSIVLNSDDSEENESTELNENPITASTETSVAPTSKWHFQKLENVNTPKPPENNTVTTTETSWQKIPQTTLEEDSTTDFPQDIQVTPTNHKLQFTQIPNESSTMHSTIKYQQRNKTNNTTYITQAIKVTHTDDQLKFTLVPEKSSTTSFNGNNQKMNETNNISFPIQLSKENFQKLNIPLSETVEKISIRVNVLADNVLEGHQGGKLFRQITPLIGVERKIELNTKFKNQGLVTFKKELGYNWDKFMEDLIQRFFGNRTNEGPNSLEIEKSECKDKVVDTDSKFTVGVPLQPSPPKLPYNYNYGAGFLTPNQQVNNPYSIFRNPYSMFQNPGTQSNFNKHKERFESMNTFNYPPLVRSGFSYENYPPIGKPVNSYENSVILFKNKQPVYRIFGLTEQELPSTAKIVNHPLPSFSSFFHLEENPKSAILTKLLNATKTSSLIKFGKSHQDNGKIDDQISSSNLSEQIADVEPEFRVPGAIKLEIYHKMVTPKHLSAREAQNPNKVEVEEKTEDNTITTFFNRMFGLLPYSSS